MDSIVMASESLSVLLSVLSVACVLGATFASIFVGASIASSLSPLRPSDVIGVEPFDYASTQRRLAEIRALPRQDDTLVDVHCQPVCVERVMVVRDPSVRVSRVSVIA